MSYYSYDQRMVAAQCIRTALASVDNTDTQDMANALPRVAEEFLRELELAGWMLTREAPAG